MINYLICCAYPGNVEDPGSFYPAIVMVVDIMTSRARVSKVPFTDVLGVF